MNPHLRVIDSDVLIIGSGIAGLEAALAVSRAGKKPLLVSNAPRIKSTHFGKWGSRADRCKPASTADLPHIMFADITDEAYYMG